MAECSPNFISMRVCSIEGCDNPSRTAGYCASHYKRLLRHGDPLGGSSFRHRLNPLTATKRCSMCSEEKSREEDYHSGSSRCKPCASLAAREWRRKNPRELASMDWRERKSHHHQDCYRKAQIKYRYGISIEEFWKMLADQENKCAICHEEFETTPHIDHCHGSKKVRGLLCQRCNRGIGMFRENKGFLSAAIEYLEMGEEVE